MEDVGARLDGVVTFHDGCHALRELDIKDAPAAAARRTCAAWSCARWTPAEECCGFGGTFSVKFAEVSGAMARTKIDAIDADRREHGGFDRSELPDADSGRAVARRARLSAPCIWPRCWRAAECHDPCPPSSTRRSHEALADPKLQLAIYTATGRLMEKRAKRCRGGALPDYQELRTQANAIKRHTIEHLDYYLEQFERNVEAHGGKVVYCKDGDGGRRFRARPGEGTRRAADREVEVDDHGGSRSQRAAGTPRAGIGGDRSGRVHPATGARAAVPHRGAGAAQDALRRGRDLRARTACARSEIVIEKQTAIARAVLREKFLAADIGISGANFLVADSGAVVMVENEGNARLTTSAPKIHIAVAGIEKVIPRAQDLATFLKLLARSATGQPLSGLHVVPERAAARGRDRRAGRVLRGAARQRAHASCWPIADKRQSLYCIRCGACLNTCPVYRKIGGHSFPWVYSGPIGAILTPQFMGVPHEPRAAFRVEPVRRVRRGLPGEDRYSPNAAGAARGGEESEETREGRESAGAAGIPDLRLADAPSARVRDGGADGGSMAGDTGGGWLREGASSANVGPVRAWLSQRDLPPPPARKFPPNVEAALMSRDEILDRVRNGSGAPRRPGRRRIRQRRGIRIPRSVVRARIASLLARVDALAGGACVRRRSREAGEMVRAALGGRSAIASERAPASKSAGSPVCRECARESRIASNCGSCAHGGSWDHQRRLCAGRHRHAGDALQPAGGAHDFFAAAGAHRGRSQ